MNEHTTMTILSATLRGCLPYEYDEQYINGKDTDHSIVITKGDSERTVYITDNTPDHNSILDVTLYDDANDDEPVEIYQWDTNDPNLNLTDLIAYIKNNL